MLVRGFQAAQVGFILCTSSGTKDFSLALRCRLGSYFILPHFVVLLNLTDAVLQPDIDSGVS